MFRKALQIISAVVLLLVTVQVYGSDGRETTVTCKVNKNTGSAVFLYKIENGEAVSLGFRRPGSLDTCMFSFPMEKEGIYFIRKGGAHLPAYKFAIYLKPGEKKWVDLYINPLAIDFDSCKVKSPNAETVQLQKWTNLFNEVCRLGTNRKQRDNFIVAYNKLEQQAAELKKKTASNNRNFKRLLAIKLDADLQYARAAAFFHFGERMNAGMDSTAGRKEFYMPMANQDFCNATLLESENGLHLVKYNLGYKLFQQYGTQEKMLAASFTEKMKMICNDTIKVAYALDRMEQITNYEQFKTDIQPYKQLFSTEELIAVYQKKEDDLTVYAKGAPAYNFTLNDTKDQPVSMTDFKGKVVVMDIWAMWCAPCLAEKPHFVKVEESFKERDDIVFIGVSHDGLSKKELWKNFVAKKGWTNIELIANYDESIGKYYKVEGIPRFMIFDKEGNIVTVDAPRPSDPAFKKLIEQTLQSTSGK